MNGTMSDSYDNPFADNKSSNSLESMNGLSYALRSEALSCGRSGRSSGSSVAGTGLGLEHDLASSTPRLMESIVSQGRTYLVTITKKIG
ncbi:unnamed protein product, partial [Leptidea sinapis]